MKIQTTLHFCFFVTGLVFCERLEYCQWLNDSKFTSLSPRNIFLTHDVVCILWVATDSNWLVVQHAFQIGLCSVSELAVHFRLSYSWECRDLSLNFLSFFKIVRVCRALFDNFHGYSYNTCLHTLDLVFLVIPISTSPLIILRIASLPCSVIRLRCLALKYYITSTLMFAIHFSQCHRHHCHHLGARK